MPTPQPMDILAIVDQLDMRYLIETLMDIAREPTDASLGADVFMAPDDRSLCATGVALCFALANGPIAALHRGGAAGVSRVLKAGSNAHGERHE